MLAGQPGYQKTVIVNDLPLYLNAPINIYPEQELNARSFIQGGPRDQIYELGKKIVKGNFSFPILINKDGDVDEPVKEILECAQYPMRTLTIKTNYVLAKRYVTADIKDYRDMTDNVGFNVYSKMTFECCAITKLTISVSETDNVSANAEIIGLVSETPIVNIPALSTTGMMRRHINYAECDVYLTYPSYHWDTSKSFSISVENTIEPIYNFIKDNDKQTWTDLPVAMAMGESHVYGDITYSVDRGTAASEKLTLPTGGWMGQNLIFDISGVILIDIPHCIANLTQQPIELGLLQRKTEFKALFNKTNLDAVEGHFITFK
ncbi:MAG TPA: hypothetical protein P5523_09870 [Bacteroidales bacterium]|nr:hypothetical protein [Bacteroidales bacterium]